MSNLIGSELPLVERLRKMQGMGDYQLAALMDGVGPKAADEIEQLQAQVRREADCAEAYKAEAAHWKNNHEAEVRRARALKERTDMPLERVEAYEKWGEDMRDAARYRWLRDHAEAADWEMFGYQDIDCTDAAIDAAMGQTTNAKVTGAEGVRVD